MKRPLVALLAFLSSGLVWAGPMTTLKNESDLNKYIISGKFNGVALVARDKNVLYKKAFGVTDFKTNTPLSTNDKFLIGSNTKQFVAASLLKLQEEGKINLDDKVTDYLPELTGYSKITIRQILNHTAGIPNFTDIPEFWEKVTYESGLSLDDIINFTLKYPLEFEPATKWNYSNTGYIIAGKLVEKLSGTSWDQFIANNFLSPLGMKNTGYEEYYDKVTGVQGHVFDGATYVSIDRQFNMTWALSAGALYSTLDDLLKWTSIYDESSLLSAKSKTEMQTPFLRNYGLGLLIIKRNNDVMLNHSGRVPGFVSNINYFKNSKLKVITLDNMDGRFSAVADVLTEYFSEGQASVVKLETLALSIEKLQDYVGKYEVGQLAVEVFIKDGKLFLQPANQPAYELVANDTDSFRLLPYNFGEEFIRNADGVVVGLKNYQNGYIAEGAKK